ncbi:MAG: hypothetical protein ACYCUM_13340 [Solirubrobacteraceae bacterium]
MRSQRIRTVARTRASTAAPQARTATLLVAISACCTVLAAAGSALAAGGAKPLVGVAYTGRTSQRSAVSLRVSKNGSDVLSFTTRIGYSGQCGQGGGPVYSVKVKSMRLSKAITFSVEAKGTLPSAAAKLEPIPLRITGRIKGGTASGSIAEIGGRCQTRRGNPYAETFTASAG